MTPVQILGKIDSNNLKDEYLALENNIDWFYASTQGKQSCLQTREGKQEWIDGCGKIDDSAKIEDYNYLHHTLIGTVWEKLIKEYKMFRTRFMWINPKSCYSVHMDSSPRIHLPIITNPEALFLFRPGGFTYLMPNIAYWVDTRLHHSFVNFSDEPRLHLIGCVLE